MKKRILRRKKIIVAVSGGFDPVHVGHVRLFREAARLGDELVVILNNDHWLRKKKGFVFMPERERKELILALQGVDRVMLTSHKKNSNDVSVTRELKKLRPDIFANGGDRKSHNTPEIAICNMIGCKMAYRIGFGGKVQSSSWLVKGAVLEALCHCGSGKKFKRCHGQ